MRDARIALRAKPAVAAMLVFSGGFWASVAIAGLYLPAAFADRGLSNTLVGSIYAVMLVMDATGAMAAGRVSGYGRFSTQLVILGTVSGFLMMGTAASALWFAVGAYLVSRLLSGAMEPLMFAWFNRQLPSEQRATLLSIESWMFSLSMIVAFPLAGRLAEVQGWGALYIVCGLAGILFSLVVLLGVVLRGRRAAVSGALR